ncbi:MAG: acyltransferase [Shinella sp.]|nr:acyltransferase [Shinella sp.]
MRILLISGIVFVHIPHDPQTSPFLGTYSLFDWLRVFLGDSLFRVGVPCLSAISGYLLFRRGLDGFDYRKVLRTKAMTILVPFLIWNLAFLLLVFAAQTKGMGFGYLPDVVGATPLELADLAFAIESWPINIPLYFLRDLLLCLLLSPLLGFLMMRYPRVTLLILLAYAVLPVPNGIFLKKSILFGFCVGIYVSLHKIDVKRLDPYAAPIFAAVFAAAVALSVGLYQTGPEFPVWLDALRSLLALSGILGAWALSSMLVATRFGMALSSGGGLSFWIFCGHYPLLILCWMVWNRLGISHYPLFYCMAPLVTLAVLVITHMAVKRTLPGLHGLLTGSRAAPSRTAPAGSSAAAGRTKYSPQQR